MTEAQKEKIEWLKELAERSFNEQPTNKESCTFEAEVDESEYTNLVFLCLSKKAKPKTGLLFLFDTNLLVTIGPNGGIKSAKYLMNDSMSKTQTTKHVRHGIVSMF